MTKSIESMNAAAKDFQTVDVGLRLAQTAAAQPVYASVNGHAQAIIAHSVPAARSAGRAVQGPITRSA